MRFKRRRNGPTLPGFAVGAAAGATATVGAEGALGAVGATTVGAVGAATVGAAAEGAGATTSTHGPALG
jgi:hypothetical protein